MEVRLSARMKALADLVTPGALLADVGTDHGYIPIYLCRTGKISGAVALDVNRGPLQRAKTHVAEYGLQDNVDLRLSDGLEALLPGEADTILIAGMGGALIKRILSKGASVLDANPELILQPQSEIASVRRYLREIGYVIVDEDCVLEDGKFYFLMKALRGRNADPGAARLDLEDAFGPILLEKKHPGLQIFLEREIAVFQQIRTKLDKQMEASGFQKDLRAASACPEIFCKENKEALREKKLEKRLWEINDRLALLEEAYRIFQS